MKELKVRVGGEIKQWLSRLSKLGPQIKDVHVEDFYFKTDGLDVLKISRKETGDFLVRFKHEKGNFIVQPKERIENFEDKLKELYKKHGLKKIIKRHQVVYELENGTIEIDCIEGLGNFLVLVQAEPEIDWFRKNLNLKDPEQITVPFSDL